MGNGATVGARARACKYRRVQSEYVFMFAGDPDRADEWIDAGPGVLDRLCLSLGPHEYLFIGPDVAAPRGGPGQRRRPPLGAVDVDRGDQGAGGGTPGPEPDGADPTLDAGSKLNHRGAYVEMLSPTDRGGIRDRAT